MDKSKMKAIRRQVIEAGLANKEKIEKVSKVTRDQSKDLQMDIDINNMTLLRKRVRAEVLDELWAAPKLNKDGYWYIKLSDAIKIIGE